MSGVDQVRGLPQRIAQRAQLTLGITAVFSALEGLHARVEQLALTSQPAADHAGSTLGAEPAEGQPGELEALLNERIGVLEGRLRANAMQIHALESRLERVRTDHESLQDGLAAVDQVVSAARLRPSMWGLALRPFRDDVAGHVYGFWGAAESSPRGELYRRLLDVFGGAPAVVQERRRPYLDLIDEHSPVVDIGCGRGDFLDLLQERGTSYLGVEPDGGMLAAAGARGHSELVEDDANSYLEGVPDDSLGTVFCAQVIEHMPPDYLLRFIDLSLAKLKPGGILILEAPNPHSPHTNKIFWVDITHRAPVFPEVALTLCWAVGFGSAYVFHPGGSGDAEADRFRAPEYAVVATKGGAEDTAPAQ